MASDDLGFALRPMVPGDSAFLYRVGVARALTGGVTACTHWSDRLPTGWRYCPELLEVYR